MGGDIDTSVIADAFRAALAKGDQELADSKIDRKILQAMVARSAADTLQWVQTRVPNGTALGKPLEDLLPALEKGNTIGAGLRSAQQRLAAEARTLVLGWVTGSSWPLWLTAVATFFGGAFGHAQQAGADVGAVLIPALFAGGSIGYALFRSLGAASQGAGAVATAAGNLWESTDAIGVGAQRVFSGIVEPTLLASNVPMSSDPILGALRGTAKLIVGASFALAAVCGIYFVTGFINAWEAWSDSLTNPCFNC